MQLSITVNPNDPQDVNAGIASLRKLLDMGQIEATFTPVTGAPLTIDKLDDPSVGAEKTASMMAPSELAAATKATRTRKPKEAAVQAGESSAPVDTPENTSASSTDGSPIAPASTGPAPSIDAVRDALKAYTSKNGMEAGIALLAKFGAERISAVPEDKRAEFVKECGV